MELLLAKILEELSFEDVLKVLLELKKADEDAFNLLNELIKEI